MPGISLLESLAVLVKVLQIVLASDCNQSTLPTILFGQSVPLTGNEGMEGILYRDGVLAAFQEFNDDARQDKRFTLDLQVKDDGGDASVTKANVETFVADPTMFGIIGLFGTTSTEQASLVAFAKGLPVLVPYGGMALRQAGHKLMINLRASYYDEAAALVEYLHKKHDRRRIALFGQNGPFGEVTRDGMLTALDSNNVYLHSYTVYSHDGDESLWYHESVAALDDMQSIASSNGELVEPDCIIIAADYAPASVFIPLARGRFPNATLASLSRVSVKILIDVLTTKLGNASILNGMFVSGVVPLPTDPSLRAVRRYQAALARMNNYKWAYWSLEGYLVASLAIEVLERIRGLQFTPELFVQALYETCYFNVAGLQMGPFMDQQTKEEDGFPGMESCNQGMRQVFLIRIGDNNSLAKADEYHFETCGYRAKQWDVLYFGQSCEYNTTSCADFRDGVLAAFRQVNDADGIRGTTRLKMITKEDYGNETLATANNLAMMHDPSIIGLIGSSYGIANLLNTTSDSLVVGAFDGEVSLRTPFRRNIVNVRASTRDEAFAIVHHCYYQLRLTRISILYEVTGFGEQALQLFEQALDEKRLSVYTQVGFTADNVTEAVANLFDGNGQTLQVVVFIGKDDVFGQVVVEIHGRNRKVMVFGLSKTMTTQLLLPENINKVNWSQVLLTSSVPDVTNPTIAVVNQYLNALKNLDSTLHPSSSGLEGFIVGQIVAIALNNVMAKEFSVQNVLDSLYDHGIFRMADFRCGPFLDASHDHPGCNQCMKQVFFGGFRNGSMTSDTGLTPFEFETCMYTPSTNFDFDLNGSRLVLVIVAAIGGGYTVIIMLMLVLYRQNEHVRPISVRFALVSCFGAVLCFGGVLLLYPIPTDVTCALGPWLSDLAFVTLFGPIFAKAYRIDRIFNGKKLKRQVISDVQVFRIFATILVGFVMFLMVYTILDAPRMEEAFTYDGVRYETCLSDHKVFVQIDYVLKALVLVWGCFLCQRVSKVSGQFARFNESKEMVLCIYHTTFLAMCLLLIGLTTQDKPNIQFTCVSALLMENTLVVVTVLYAHRVWCAVRKVQVTESSETSHSSNSGASGSSAMFVSRPSTMTMVVAAARISSEAEPAPVPKLSMSVGPRRSSHACTRERNDSVLPVGRQPLQG